jgi:hypothetical protein
LSRSCRSSIPELATRVLFLSQPPAMAVMSTSPWPGGHGPPRPALLVPTGTPRHHGASPPLPCRRQAPSRPEPAFPCACTAPIHDEGLRATIETLPGG